MPSPTESIGIKALRLSLQNWPLRRGKGLILRLARPFVSHDSLWQLAPGVLIPCELEDWQTNHLFVHGLEAEPSFGLSWSLLKAGDTVLDIGANIGLWAMRAAVIIGDNGRLHAFEPLPANITRLERNLALNSIENVMVHSIAVSDTAGEAVFYSPESRSSGTGRLAPREGLRPELKVATATLDSLLVEGTIGTPGFIKMDVEGAELRVLRGAQRLLASDNAPMIMFELNE